MRRRKGGEREVESYSVCVEEVSILEKSASGGCPCVCRFRNHQELCLFFCCFFCFLLFFFIPPPYG